jgi:hypothetical protein
MEPHTATHHMRIIEAADGGVNGIRLVITHKWELHSFAHPTMLMVSHYIMQRSGAMDSVHLIEVLGKQLPIALGLLKVDTLTQKGFASRG